MALIATLIATTPAPAQSDRGDRLEEDKQPAATTQPDPAFRSDLLRYVEDNQPVQNESRNRFEAQCYKQLVLHARRLPEELMRRSATERVNFAHMFGDDRARYRGKLVHIAGKLRRLRQLEPPETLIGLDDGLTALYEAWIFDEHFGDNPYCVIVSELPAGIAPGESLNRPVETDAYFFKRYRYAAKDGWRDAPLLIGRTMRATASSPAQSAASIWQMPANTIGVVLAVVAAVLAAGGMLIWWFRRNDRQTRRQLDSVLRDTGLAPDWEKLR